MDNNSINVKNKYLILYVAHFINDFSLSQYYKLKNELPDGYDIVWWLDDNCRDNLIDGIKFVKFPHNSIINNSSTISPTRYFENIFLNINDYKNYKYYWFIEYDNYYNGNWKTFFNDVDNNCNADLVCTNFKHIKKECVNKSDWFWKRNATYEQYSSILSLYRLSNIAMETIAKYNQDDLKSYIYELYVPTIIYNNNLTFANLNNNNQTFNMDEETKDYFNYFSNDGLGYIDSKKDFWWNVTFYDKNEMTKPNKLYTRYKPNKYW